MTLLRIGLCSLAHPETVAQGVERITEALREARQSQRQLVCFSETYLPGLRGAGYDLPKPDGAAMQEALDDLCAVCRETGVAAIVGMEWVAEHGLDNRAWVIDGTGRVLGHQTKNQITPDGESDHYLPDRQRRVFQIAGVKFGIAICHEAWRYPETVRWAAVRGAKVVFQPQFTGSDHQPIGPALDTRLTTRDSKDAAPSRPLQWGESFYEKAMLCRAQENSIYFASVNQALRWPNSHTSLIGPSGQLISHLPWGKEGILSADIDASLATGRYAARYDPALYPS